MNYEAFPQKRPGYEKKVFNYRLTQARRYVECAFGILSNKWRVFRGNIQIDPSDVDNVVKSACALHNSVRQKEGYNFEDSLSHDLDNVTWQHGRITEKTWNVKEMFATYFMSPEGELPWQDSKIFKNLHACPIILLYYSTISK